MAVVAAAGLGLTLTACGHEHAVASDGAAVTLRIGLGQQPSAPGEGLRGLAQLQAVESLANLADDGRPRPWLARDWTVSGDGKTLTVNLQHGVRFHDGTPVTAAAVADTVRLTLPTIMGPAAEDVADVSAPNDEQVLIRFRRPSPFLLDSLEVPIQKKGSPLVGTGPFVVTDPKSPTEMHANSDYHLGRPTVDRITVEMFPSVRAAWAEMLRDRIDMLYQVGLDALDSLETSNSVSIFSHVRHYQYVIVLNNQAEVFRAKDVRRALNLAIDRNAIVSEALNGHGTVSFGPVWPHNYAISGDLPKFTFDAHTAATLLSGKRRTAATSGGDLHFTCLVRADAVSERIALTIKRQLQAVGVDMAVEEVGMDHILDSIKSRKFEAAFLEPVSGPTLLRPYQMWHSKGFLNADSPAIDAALDRVRYAASDGEYRKAVESFQQAVVDDPPAIFLAWIEVARAVSKRFTVPAREPGRDVLFNLRLWKPVAAERRASRN
jgi:peptide/nickel transport system substrate-binding protein